MKYISLALAVSIALMGCKTTTHSQSEDNRLIENENSAKPSDIHFFLTQQVKKPKKVKKIVAKPVKKYRNVWARIKDNVQLDIPINENVIKHRNTYLQNPPALNYLLRRAEPYLFYIIEKLEQNNIPIEIALLPLVESAFDPSANSNVNASGLWQFLPNTGKQFGMKQNWWFDGRRDIIASTDGAIKYLKYLHRYFKGDWMLALAAYNSGEARVKRAMRVNERKNRPTRYWELTLPKETKDYVPKLLAIIDIIQSARAYKIKLHNIPNKPLVKTINVNSQIDLTLAAGLAELPLEEFVKYNPGFNQWATEPNSPTQFLLPNKNYTIFKNSVKNLSPKELMLWQRYKIKSGDSLGLIANKFNVDIDSLKTINEISGSGIKAGKYLLIPVASTKGSIDYTKQVKKGPIDKSKTKVIHTVKSGDTLWDISKAYKVRSKDIAQWNNISPSKMLKLNQKLVIWRSSKNLNAKNVVHKVRSGDSFARIANKYNVSIKEIERWNRLSRKKYLQPGQSIKILYNN